MFGYVKQALVAWLAIKGPVDYAGIILRIESFHLKSATFSHPPILTILDYALKIITGCFGYLMKEF